MSDLVALREQLTAERAKRQALGPPPPVTPKEHRAIRTKKIAVEVLKAYPYPTHAGWKVIAPIRLANPKISSRKLSEAIDRVYSHETICKWLRDPKYHAYEQYLLDRTLSELPPDAQVSVGTVRARFLHAAPDAAEHVITVMETVKDPKVQLDACKEILDRAGVAKVTTINHNSMHFTMTPELMDRMAQRRRELLAEPAPVVDGELVGASA